MLLFSMGIHVEVSNLMKNSKMEKEIAGKILLCLRSTPRKSNTVLPNYTYASSFETNTGERNGISKDEITISSETAKSFIGSSFSQYIAQIVDGLPNLNLDDVEKLNNEVLQYRKEINNENNSLWFKSVNFWKEYWSSYVKTRDSLHELKTVVSSFTNITSDNEVKKATLIIFNLFLNEKTSTNRKEELQRIFSITDFKGISKLSNAIYEILKIFPPKEFEDFIMRWNEVFKDRIEELEKFFCMKSKCKSEQNRSRSSIDYNLLSTWDCNIINSKESDTIQLLKEIVIIEELMNKNVLLNVIVNEKNMLNDKFRISQIDANSNNNQKIVEIEIAVTENLDNSGTENLIAISELKDIINRINRIKFLCAVHSNFMDHKVDRNEAIKILISVLKSSLQHERKILKLKNYCNNIKQKKVNTETLLHNKSLIFKSDVENMEIIKNKNDVFGKNWIEKQLKNSLDRTIIESINYKLIVFSILDLVNSQISNEELYTKLIEIFSLKNVFFIETLIEHRENIKTRCKLTHQKKGIQKLAKFELDKLQQLLNEQRLMCYDNEFIPTSSTSGRSTRINFVECRLPNTDHSSKQIKEHSNIYDLNSETMMSPSFISGTKIMLPERHTRKDTKTYEEINIPIPVVSLIIKNQVVDISSLDKIGQSVFSGIQTLNRIQSIVFNTAYHSNENILVCAPTGAGKTNVALLTIVHEIKQNIENDVIRKDKFKIIYIAPMKALASEMTQNFNIRLKSLGIVVKELTGDMQLTKSEIASTQLLVTTPEKWDLVTRKGDGDTTLSSLVKLLIIDEVHLLQSDRGPVIEALVARTLRQVETSQKMIRIVGLSATLPNYKDVATFLRVNLLTGLFYFDSRFRPVPLSQCFIGVKARKPMQQLLEMNQVCYDKIFENVKNGMQVMVFVHARNSTMKTAMSLREIAQQKGHLSFFEPNEDKFPNAKKIFEKAKAKQLHDLLPYGFSIHHAGLLRYDRNLVEDCFSKGFTRILVCTSTLAWGVNLPAHTVIIKGTEIYDSKHGSFIDLGILDVLQIFGRAGRPQFNESGHGIIITTHNKLYHYLSLMMNQFPIESRFISYLADNLNAEISLGTITCIEEAIEWLSYTYLFVRMRINPQEYGINYTDVEKDYTLYDKRKELIEHSAKILDKLQMVRYNEEVGKLSPTDLGRTASLFYVKYDTIEIFSSMLQNVMNEAETLNMLSQAYEFEQLKVRDEEMDELDQLQNEYCEYIPKGGSENIHGKVNILLQAFLSRGRVKSFSLISDIAYIAQNASRIMRALFDIVLKKNNPILAGRFLQICQMFEHQQWYFETPLRQFTSIPYEIISKIEQREISVEKLKEMDFKEIGIFLRHAKMGTHIKKCVEEFPMLILAAIVQPITRAVLRIRLNVKADFRWNEKIHGRTAEPFWVWVEDPDTNFMYHSEYFFITRKQVMKNEIQELIFTIPVHEPLPSVYVVRVSSDRWLGSVSQTSITLHDLVLPELHPVQTELLPLQPLPVTALQSPEFESLYKFTHFNPIQTQIFHCLYHTDNNVLLGAPTGSGKTIVAELAFLRVFRQYPDAKVVYIAPLKALVKERIRDWKVKFQKKLKKEVVELTGDVTPDIQAICCASIIVTTPEKWDSISRSWQTRNYVKKVVLIVIDEIHLLGEDRGPVLEVIVSRTNFIVSHTHKQIRIVGLSTALANAQDLADWLRINECGMYNFRPSVRPVPLEVHISAFPGKYYCPRMATMNKPAFQAIKQYSPLQPVLIFVSSRRQTRLTAMDLLAQLASENNPKQWLKLKDAKLNRILDTIKDDNLKVMLAFGIGLHHAGLQESDRKTVEELFEHQHLQVLIATSTLAWGVNFPAHLVIVKGTEYYDCKTHRYIDMPITDILQMMGRAGRPQFDKQGIAVIMVHDVKKNFYKKFLYEPFPVESSLLAVLPDHLNAEIVAGTIKTSQDAIDYLTWTYFFRRLLKNPVFYNISVNEFDINSYLTSVVNAAIVTLESSQCLVIDEDERSIHPTTLGRISSYYYISHQTMLHFKNNLSSELTIDNLLYVLSHAYEYNEIPVRHNEEITNSELARNCKIKLDSSTFDSPYTKTHLLFQAHFLRLVLPCTDYYTDLKSILDQAIRILQAMIDVCGEHGWLVSTLRAQQLMQMIIQGRWITDHPLLTLPGIELRHLHLFFKISHKLPSLPYLYKQVYKKYGEFLNLLQHDFSEIHINKIYEIICNLPKIHVELSLSESVKENQPNLEDEDIPLITTKIDLNTPVTVKANREYVLQIKLTQVNKRKDSKVYAPKFSKPKEENWFLTFGVIKYKELLAMKRFSFGQRKEVFHNFIYKVPNEIGRTMVTVYILSDSYIGLDQQYNIHLTVIP